MVFRQFSRLFHHGELRNFLAERQQRLEGAVESLDRNRLVSASVEELTAYLVEPFRLEVPRLRRPDAELDDPHEIDLDSRRLGPNPNFWPGGEPTRISGIRYTLEVPFEGSADLFEYAPSQGFVGGGPRATIHDGKLILTSDRLPTDSAEAVKNEFNAALDDIEQWLGWVNKDVRDWLARLDGVAKARIQSRREKLVAAQGAAASMGFKLRERAGPRTFAAPEVRRKVAATARPAPPPGSSATYTPEPALADSDYEHIISVISSMAMVIERSPAAFERMEEEHLRFLFLVPLNGHYEGQATGETFNFEGKTDVLIRIQGRNIFIAECKFWKGAKGLSETVDQLLRYTSWRDTKTALILFNRNKDFSAVLHQIRPTVEAHPNFKSFIGRPNETQFRFVLKQPSDASRELLLTVLAFDVPQGVTG